MLTAVIFLIAALVYLPGRLLVVSQPLKPVDAVVVLSGGEGRVEYAAQIFQDVGAKWFVITETGDHVPGYPESVSAFDAVRAMRLGVPEQAIYITPQESSDTAGEAGEVRRVVLDTGVKSLVVVTDPWHTRRAQILFWRVLRGLDVELRMRAVAGNSYRPLTWWRTAEQRELTFQEYAKIVYTLVKWLR
jgi:uncharacterized SAM-binding protein YcdF (DUF218 family)